MTMNIDGLIRKLEDIRETYGNLEIRTHYRLDDDVGFGYREFAISVHEVHVVGVSESGELMEGTGGITVAVVK